ncbi:MAG: S8 family serine peptidase [Chloroflexi bacterium]|nr:S8 family serine peptidase [Chloroflexota bacterium]
MRGAWLLSALALIAMATVACAATGAAGGGSDSSVSRVNPARVARSAELAPTILPQRPLSGCEDSDARRCLDTVRNAALATAVRKDTVLSWPLVQLVEADGQAEAQSLQLSASNTALLPKPLRDLLTAQLMRMDETGRVQMFVHTDGPARSAVSALEDVDAHIERVADEYDIIQAWVPIRRIGALARTPGVARMRLPDYGVPSVGSVTTEGDALLGAADARSTFGIDGSGVRVGVISDGVEGLAASQASGDLPAVNTTTCDVGPGTPTSLDAGAEGTAMLEIVHDLAPGAELWYGFYGRSFGGTVLDFMAAVNCLAQNVDVVVDDIGWFNVGPYDGTSIVSVNASDALNDPANRIRGYYNAVGNQALEHYQETYIDSGFNYEVSPDFWDLHFFTATSSTSDAGIGLPCACADAVALLPGESLVVILQWNDSWGTSANDYDLFLLLGTAVVAVGGDPQDGSGFPTEVLAYTNESLDIQFLDLEIGNFNGTAAPRTFDMFLRCAGCIPLPDDLIGQPIHNYNTPCSSVSNNSDAGGGVVSLGAINAADPGLDDLEPFSSCGPTNDGRIKPDAVAVDGVAVTGNGGFSSSFLGTSAAAPHAAGVAALLLECNPSLSRAELRATLLDTAVDLGPPGPDNDFGYGRLDALAAVTSDGCEAPTATPTNTPPLAPTATPAPTAIPTPTAIPGGGMSLNGPTTVSVGKLFTLSVSADPAPDVEIAGFGSEVLFPAGMEWLQRPSCIDEVQVGRQDAAPLAFCQSFTPILTGGAAHAVLSEFAQPAAALDVAPGSTTPLVELDFVCNTPGSYKLTLTAVPDSNDGAVFGGTDGREIRVGTIQQDYDGDSVPNDVADTVTIECVERLDSDGDGCTDEQELGPNRLLGGQRNPLDFWDFFDPNRDGAVSLLDFLAVLARVGTGGDPTIDPLSEPPPPPAYHTRFDRTGASPGGNPWQSGPPDGTISLRDFLALLAQFGHTCA